MKLQNFFAVITCFSTGFLVFWNPTASQQEYPSTGANKFVNADEWAVSAPDELDQSKNANSDMSPDHWGGSANLENPNSYRTVQTEKPWDGPMENHPWIYTDGLSEELITEFNNRIHAESSEQPETDVDSQSVENATPAIVGPNQSPTRAVGSNRDNDIAVPMPPSSQNRTLNRAEGEADPQPSSSGSQALPGLGIHYGNQPAPATKQSPPQPSVPVPATPNVPQGIRGLEQPLNLGHEIRNYEPTWQSPQVRHPYAKQVNPVEPEWYDSWIQYSQPGQSINPQRQAVSNQNNQGAAIGSDANPVYAGESAGGSFPAPNYRPDLGFHSQNPTTRYWMDGQDYGQQFGYEKKESPSLSELLATRKNFGSAELLIIKPFFQGGTAIAGSNGFSESLDFDHELASRFELGFETKTGPGVYFNYFQFDQDSNPSVFASDGVIAGTTSVWMAGPSQWSRISAANAGETLTTQAGQETHLFNFAFFKDIKFPIAHVTGGFGFTYASISQELNAVLTNGGGVEIGRLTQISDFDAYGPSANLEYVRPIGHTKLEFVSSLGSAFLFGNRDQIVLNSATGDFSVFGADEFVSIFDLNTGVQWRRYIGETRSVYWKLAWETQTWFNGGSAMSTDSDFGYRGLGFTVGFNR